MLIRVFSSFSFKRQNCAMQYLETPEIKPALPWQKSIHQGEGSFHQEIGLKLDEENSKVVHLKHSHVWY
jgi:hypothetical protein